MLGESSASTIKWVRLIGWGGALALLALPAIAMQFSDEVRWDREDFLAMGAMLLTLGLGLEATFGLVRQGKARVLIAALLVLGFFAVWAELAVGIFD
jgi:hypothetical protein